MDIIFTKIESIKKCAQVTRPNDEALHGSYERQLVNPFLPDLEKEIMASLVGEYDSEGSSSDDEQLDDEGQQAEPKSLPRTDVKLDMDAPEDSDSPSDVSVKRRKLAKEIPHAPPPPPLSPPRRKTSTKQVHSDAGTDVPRATGNPNISTSSAGGSNVMIPVQLLTKRPNVPTEDLSAFGMNSRR